MTNEEKAKEIARGCFSKRTVDSPVNKLNQVIIKDACLKAMKWKDEQIKSNLVEAFNCMIFCQDHSLSNKEHQYIDLDKAQDIIESFFHIKLDENE